MCVLIRVFPIYPSIFAFTLNQASWDKPHAPFYFITHFILWSIELPFWIGFSQATEFQTLFKVCQYLITGCVRTGALIQRSSVFPSYRNFIVWIFNQIRIFLTSVNGLCLATVSLKSLDGFWKALHYLIHITLYISIIYLFFLKWLVDLFKGQSTVHPVRVLIGIIYANILYIIILINMLMEIFNVFVWVEFS